MHNEFVKRSGSLLLVSSIWFGIMAIPATGFAQEQPKETPKESKSPKADKSAKSDKKDQSNKSANPAATPPHTLSAHDDPSQIGKRDINKGLDKFFGGLG